MKLHEHKQNKRFAQTPPKMFQTYREYKGYENSLKNTERETPNGGYIYRLWTIVALALSAFEIPMNKDTDSSNSESLERTLPESPK